MIEPPSKQRIFFTTLVPILVFIFIVIDMRTFWSSAQQRRDFVRDMLARPGGTMTFRFILQPCMAAFAALRNGLRDARAGRSPYFWTLLFKPEERMGRLREGIASTSQIILLGLIMDMIYQFIVLKTFYAAQAMIVALVLAFIPYVLLRGPFARIASLWYRHRLAASNPTDKDISQ
jgi:hypothetical protein